MTTKVPDSWPTDTCNATFHGSHSYGGAGPGTDGEDVSEWDITIWHGSEWWEDSIGQNGPNNLMTYHVSGQEYGGKTDITLVAQWNDGGNAWYSCKITIDGKDYPGKVQKSIINSGTVSVVEDSCVIDKFPC